MINIVGDNVLVENSSSIPLLILVSIKNVYLSILAPLSHVNKIMSLKFNYYFLKHQLGQISNVLALKRYIVL